MIIANSGFVPVNRGHSSERETGNYCRYTVYDNRTDMPLVVDATADECARILKRSRNSFYSMVTRVLQGKIKKYTVVRRMVDEDDLDA